MKTVLIILAVILLLIYAFGAVNIIYRFIKEEGEIFMGIMFGLFWPVIFLFGKIVKW